MENLAGDGDTMNLFNNTIYNIEDDAICGCAWHANSTVNFRNNISVGNGGSDITYIATGTLNTSNNLSSDATAT